MKLQIKNILVSVVVLLLVSEVSMAGANSGANNQASATKEMPKTSGTAKQPNILDFDADVIEGERTGPSLLVQMDLQAPNLDMLVFERKNFNDFHGIDMKRKPKYRGRLSK